MATATTAQRLGRLGESAVVCGRRVERVLPGGLSVLCRDLVGEGRVVLKPLPRGCLHVPFGSADAPAELHPHVRDRLERVRELAEVRVAGLCGVEEDAALGVMAVWRYVEGVDLGHAGREELTGGGVLETAMRIVEAVEGLHLLGLVHGRLHPRNVILTSGGDRSGEGGRGGVVLTHLSPLFVDDPAVDASDLAGLLRALNARHVPWDAESERQHAVLARVLSEAHLAGMEAGGGRSVELLRERLLEAGAVREGVVGATGGSVASVSRGAGAWWAAVAWATVGLVVAAAVLWAFPPAWLEVAVRWVLGWTAGGSGGGAG